MKIQNFYDELYIDLIYQNMHLNEDLQKGGPQFCIGKKGVKSEYFSVEVPISSFMLRKELRERQEVL